MSKEELGINLKIEELEAEYRDLKEDISEIEFEIDEAYKKMLNQAKERRLNQIEEANKLISEVEEELYHICKFNPQIKSETLKKLEEYQQKYMSEDSDESNEV